MRTGHGGAGQRRILIIRVGTGNALSGSGDINIIAVIGKGGFFAIGTGRCDCKHLRIGGRVPRTLGVVIPGSRYNHNIAVVGIFNRIMEEL
ncbi:hypothetical protein D3C74_365880 [compost metagenome]